MILARSNIVLNEQYIQSVFIANIKRIRVEARHAILPPPDIRPSEWADQSRYMPNGQKWRTKDAPHTREVMDWIIDERVREISIMGSAQCAKTEIILNIIGYFIDIDPRRIILMFPTDGNAKDFVRTKLDPMINDSPSLRRKVKHIKRSANEKESAMFKKFPGGWLKIITGSSTAGTRGISCDVTITDDVDQLVIGQQREGDPAERLKKRSTTNKYKSLNINVSTPTILGQSRIDAYYGKSSMSLFKVTCPHCNTDFNFKSERLVWKKDYEETLFTKDLPDEQKKILNQYPGTAVYPCDNCGAEINEKQRLEMLEAGHWEDQKENLVHKGAFINEISSTLSSFEAVAKQIIDMNDHPEKREVLYNTVFGLPYSRETSGEKEDPDKLLARVEDYIDMDNPFVVPNEIYFAVMSGDVQKNRNEIMVLGVGYKMELWVLLYQKLPGDPLQKKVFKQSDQVYFADWRRKNGTKLPILRQWYDCGYLQQTVFEHTRGRFHKGVCAIKGKGGYGVPVLPKTIAQIDPRTRRIDIGSNAAKHQIFQMLKIEEPGPNYIHFCSAYCDEDFFKQLTAEHAIIKYTGLIQYIVYDKINREDRNEALDLMYYAYAAALHVNPVWERLKINQEKLAASVKEKEVPANYKVENKIEKPEAPKAVNKIIKRGRRVHARRR